MNESHATKRDNKNHPPQKRAPANMHENVPEWCDCCSCEAEPRWQQAGEELVRRGLLGPEATRPR